MKFFNKILSYLVFISLIIGIVLKDTYNDQLGDIIIGFAVLIGTFVFMPIFLAIRWKGKKLKDYTLSDENLKKMREKSKDFNL